MLSLHARPALAHSAGARARNRVTTQAHVTLPPSGGAVTLTWWLQRDAVWFGPNALSLSVADADAGADTAAGGSAWRRLLRKSSSSTSDYYSSSSEYSDYYDYYDYASSSSSDVNSTFPFESMDKYYKDANESSRLIIDYADATCVSPLRVCFTCARSALWSVSKPGPAPAASLLQVSAVA